MIAGLQGATQKSQRACRIVVEPSHPAWTNLMVEIGHFPSWPRIEIRKPCISSSQTLSTVPAFPSVRIAALPTSSDWACSNSPRIVDARTFAVGMGQCLQLKGAQVVTGARQSDVGGTLDRQGDPEIGGNAGNRTLAHALI
jgi:hypothetical protein